MPTNRNKRSRKREGIELNESIEELFFTGKAERGTVGHELLCSRFFDDSQGQIEEAWEQHRECLLKKWKAEKRKGKPWILKINKVNP